MALKRLYTGEMVQLSETLVTEGSPARDAILNTEGLAGLLPKIEAAHNALHETQPGPDDSRLAALQEKEAVADLRHDTLVRGSYMYLSALALLSPDGATGAAFEGLRDFLLPEGLDTTQLTYRGESGSASLLKTRLAGNAGAKKQLKEIPVLKQSLGHFVDGWIAAAAKLGELEQERAQIVAAVGEGARILAARNQWIRVINALVANAALADLDEDTDRLIFGALRLAEKTADRRAKSPAEPAPPEADPAAKPA